MKYFGNNETALIRMPTKKNNNYQIQKSLEKTSSSFCNIC